MKKTFTKIQGFAMFALTLALGIVDASGMLAAATVIPQGTNGNAPKAGVGLVGANDGNMSEGQIRGLVADKTNGDIGDYYDDSVDSEIVKFRPDLSPLDTITRQMKAKKAETMRFNWYSVDLLPHTTTLAQDTTATAYTMTVADHKCIHEGDTIKVGIFSDMCLCFFDFLFVCQWQWLCMELALCSSGTSGAKRPYL